MCTELGVSLAMQGVGTALKAGSAYAHGVAAKAADNLSAEFEDRAAMDAIMTGSIKELSTTMRGGAVEAAQRVGFSGGGADVNAGGQAATQRASQAVIEVNRAVVRRNAALAGYGLRGRARQYRQAGEYAEKAGEAEAMGTFLSGAGKFASMGMKILNDNVGTGSDTAPSDDGSNDYD